MPLPGKNADKVKISLTLTQEQFARIDQAMHVVFDEYDPDARILRSDKRTYLRRALLFASDAVVRENNRCLDDLTMRTPEEKAIANLDRPALQRILAAVHFKLHPEDAEENRALCRH